MSTLYVNHVEKKNGARGFLLWHWCSIPHNHGGQFGVGLAPLEQLVRKINQRFSSILSTNVLPCEWYGHPRLRILRYGTLQGLDPALRGYIADSKQC